MEERKHSARQMYFGHPLQKKVFIFLLATYVIVAFGTVLLAYLIQREFSTPSIVICAASIVVISTLFSLQALKFTNQILGPIYSIKLQLERRLENGSKTPISVRDYDEFKDLVLVLNAALEKK